MSATDRPPPLSTEAQGDIARAETVLPLPPNDLFVFLHDIERLVHLNPQLSIVRWLSAEQGFRFAGRNESNDRPFDIGVQVAIDTEAATLSLRYDAGLKLETVFRIEPVLEGTKLVVTERYPRIADAHDPRVAEVDKSLIPWVGALRRHLLARRRWMRLPGWQWWNESFMLSMKPHQRRIVRLLIWISAIEFTVFLGLVIVLRSAA